MKKFLIYFSFSLFVFILGIAMFVYGGIRISVSGTVYAKDDFKNMVAVHPDNPAQYNDYDKCLTFSEYSKLDIGSHVLLDAPRDKVSKNYTNIFDIYAFIFLVVGALTACVVLGNYISGAYDKKLDNNISH